MKIVFEKNHQSVRQSIHSNLMLIILIIVALLLLFFKDGVNQDVLLIL